MSIWHDTRDDQLVDNHPNNTIDFWNAYLVTAKEWGLIEAALLWAASKRDHCNRACRPSNLQPAEESLLAAIEQVEEERNRE